MTTQPHPDRVRAVAGEFHGDDLVGVDVGAYEHALAVSDSYLAEHPEHVAPAVRAAILAPILDALEAEARALDAVKMRHAANRLRGIVHATGVDLPAAGTDVARLNRVLGVDLWRVRSFRANVQIDFDEQGRVLSVTLLNPDPAAGTEART